MKKGKSLTGTGTTALHTKFTMWLTYIIAFGASVFGQYHGMQTWMTGMEDMPKWLLVVITGAMIVLLDSAFLSFTTHMAHQRQQGERAIPTIVAMAVTGTLSISVTFFGHWSPEYSGRMQAVMFSAASLIGIMLFLFLTPLSENPRRVKARNIYKALMVHFGKVKMEDTLRQVILQTLDMELIADLLYARMDNHGYADRIASLMRPEVMSIPGYSEAIGTIEMAVGIPLAPLKDETEVSDDDDDDDGGDLLALAESVIEVDNISAEAEDDKAVTEQADEDDQPTDTTIDGMVVEFADNLDAMIERIVTEGLQVPQKDLAARYGSTSSTVSRKLGKAREACKAREADEGRAS